jgi:release factor glutamine methyltransferase
MPMTIKQFIKQAAAALAASATARLDAEVLVMHVTGLTRAQLITHADQALAPEAESRLHALLARRAHGEPVAYLTGRREFWSLELAVTPDVLIPRPVTELLVEQALRLIPAEAEWRIADLGTGSGAVALAIARERPHCRVIATDASRAALDVARSNAERLGIQNVEFRPGAWLAPLAGEIFDLIVSNPPYVAAADPHLLQGDVRFEPRAALAAGQDGLDDLRAIIAHAPTVLRTGGWLLLEHGFDQGTAVRELLTRQHLVAVHTDSDLAGRERVTRGQWPGHRSAPGS